ncbi:MAG: hypothetical protein ACKVJ7_06440 [Candidatus Poseidoniales archaeon]
MDMGRAVAVVILLILALIPLADAGPGGVMTTVVIEGDGDVGQGPLSVNLSIMGVGGATESIVNWTATLRDLEGGLIDSETGTLMVNDTEVKTIPFTIGDAPLGYSNLSIEVSGDVGDPSGGQSLTWWTMVQKLRPLDLSLTSLTVDPVDENGYATNNASLRSGDYANLTIFLVNDGDVDWNGTVNSTLAGETIATITVNSSADSATQLNVNTAMLLEGELEFEIFIENLSDGDASDDSVSSTLVIGPPPLPELALLFTSTHSQPAAGEVIDWSLNVSNTGEETFAGMISCTFADETIFSSNISLPINSTSQLEFSSTARPGLMTCTHSGMRTHSDQIATYLLDIEAASFLAAGSSTPFLLDGPWHLGDELRFSLLLRNEGDGLGHARLQISVDGETFNGDVVELDSGEAGEISAFVSANLIGDVNYSWQVTSTDGAVEGGLSGLISIPISPTQDVSIKIVDVVYDEDGIILDWQIDLSQGRSRSLELVFGQVIDGAYQEIVRSNRSIYAGSESGRVNLGDLTAPEVFIRIENTGWVVGANSDIFAEVAVPDNSIIPTMILDLPGEAVGAAATTILLQFGNEGPGAIPVGQVIILDERNNILLESATPAFTEKSNGMEVTIIWPNSEIVDISARWSVGGQVVESSKSFATTTDTATTDAGFSLAWEGIGGGILLAAVVILGVRIASSLGNADEKVRKPKSKSKSKGAEAVTDEKIVVHCPSCEVKLNVPVTYTGKVRCPDCELSFPVESSEPEPIAVEAPAPETKTKTTIEESSNELLTSSSSDDTLACPECESTIKVPYERRPAKARCPHCQVIFTAIAD